MQQYKQYHLTFVSDEDPGNLFFRIEKAKTKEEAVENALPKAKQHFFYDHSREVEIGIQLPITFYDLEKDSLTDNEVYFIVQHYPDIPNAETLGKLVIWFNDRKLNHIFQVFHNDKKPLKILEGYLSEENEIRINFEKLEQLRQEISKQENSYA